jgi:hypothetical protein
MLGISRERADIIYETLATEHYFKSVEILQSSGTLNLCMGLTCFGTMEGASQPTLEKWLSAQPLETD